MASSSPNPKLGKSQALNQVQAVTTRLANLVPSFTTLLSPVTVYQPGATSGVGNELAAPTTAIPNVSGYYGVWVAPDLYGNNAPYYVQVECIAGGGGGGGGNSVQGGSGGGGGEYSCEEQYPVTPGSSYAYVVGLHGTGGFNNSTQTNPGAAGTNGGNTVFDIAGLGLANGVVANGGTGGDTNTIGIGGAGGTGSANSVHFDGGAGGTNTSANSADNPLTLAKISGMFVGNTLSDGIIPAWFILNDVGPTGGRLNDNSLNQSWGYVTNFTGGLGLAQTATPSQVPAYASAAQPPNLPNAQAAALCTEFKIGSLSKPSAQIETDDFTFLGNKLTLSCWVQCDPVGVWSNNVNTATGVIAANCLHYTSGSMASGFALYWYNAGTGSSPNWQLFGTVSNGSSRTAVSWTQGAPTPGQWLYVVMTYNAGTLDLYVNNVLKQSATSSGYTSVPAGAFVTRIGMDPNSATNWFFGSITNLWFANDCATTALLNQAFGGTVAPTGGSGGGASGGPSANGGAGNSATGSAGGAGGTPATQPAAVAGTTTPAMGGYAGAAAGASDSAPSAPAQGSFGAGGGGSGDMTVSPALTVLTVPFSTAAAYCGTDAVSNATTAYNPNQQNNPASGLNSLLYAGGLASDTNTGSKNSMLLLPASVKAQLAGYTVTQVFLTFTNAYPTNNGESLLEVTYSADTSLPTTYNGSTIAGAVGQVPIPSGAGTIMYDISSSGIGAKLAAGTATAFIIGPGQTPTFDAYNAAAGSNFYCSVYGPGAADQFGNNQYPYLTIVCQKAGSLQQGSAGASGCIKITALDYANVPVSITQPYAGTDANGNQFAQGYTGPATAFDPEISTPGSFVPETWKAITIFTSPWLPQGGTGTPCRVKLLANTNQVTIQGEINSHGTTSATIGTLPSAYWPTNQQSIACAVSNSTGVTGQVNCISISTVGVMTMVGPISATAAVYFMSGTYHLD